MRFHQLGEKVPDGTGGCLRQTPPRAEPSGRRVAIVGSGPAGLTAAYFLGLWGHEPVIIEAMEKAGGMLRYGIPEYRLPDEALDREIDYIKRPPDAR
ncbi:MAG: NAD(P)-binding protein [Desulfobacterales bacterium]|nr:NAD(P)-binding protein [Desulfobacterales bacterium]